MTIHRTIPTKSRKIINLRIMTYSTTKNRYKVTNLYIR